MVKMSATQKETSQVRCAFKRVCAFRKRCSTMAPRASVPAFSKLSGVGVVITLSLMLNTVAVSLRPIQGENSGQTPTQSNQLNAVL